MSQLNVDNIRNRTGSNGGPNFPSGITVAVGQTAYIHGNLQVDGTETIINTETLNVADKTVGIGSTSNASNTTADGSGIEVFASSSQTGNNKTLTWGNTANSWEFGPNDVGLKVGVGVTIYGETGIVSATSFKGDGSLLTGIDATAIQTGNTSVQTVDTGSDGHVKMTTEGGERVRIGPAGQIGLGGANYGTSGQVITSAGSGSAPSWATIPPAGNTFTGIASGSIANNKAVQICQDGKLMQITATVSPRNPSNVHDAYTSSGTLDELSSAWNPRDEMIYSLGVYTNNQIHLERYQPNMSTGTFSGLGGVHLNNNVRVSNQNRTTMCYDTGNNHLVVFYNRDSPTDGAWQSICTPSGSGNTALTTSSDTLVAGDGSLWRYLSCCYEPTQGKIVLLYVDDGDSSKLYMIVGSTSGSAGSASITWGSPVLIDGNNAASGANGMDICSCGSSRVLFSWSRNDNTTYVGAATITSGDGVTDISSSFGQLATGNNAKVAWDRAADKGVTTYHSSSNTSQAGKTRLITLGSSNALTLGSELDSFNQQWDNANLSYNAKLRQVVLFYKSGGTSGYTRGAIANISGSTLTWTNDTQLNNSIDSFQGRCSSWNAADFGQSGSYGYVYIPTNNAGANRGMAYSSLVTTLSSSLKNYVQYVGFANQAYTNGQTATINTYGNNVSTLSGLTPATMYYVQGDGSIHTTAAGSADGLWSSPSNTPVAGTALNATTLLIRDPRISPNSY